MASKQAELGLLEPEEQAGKQQHVPRRRLWRTLTLALLIGVVYYKLFWPQELRIIGNGEVHNEGGLDDEFDWYSLKPSDDIEWTACYDTHKCARLSLPLDYLTPDGPKTEIALRLLPATDRENYKGVIFLNPGGPGGSGTNLITRFGDKIAKVVGPEFDLLGFDPRGTGASTPPAQCFKTGSQFKIWGLQDGPIINSTEDSVALARSRERVIGELCENAIGGIGEEQIGGTAEEWGAGRFMSSASVATDMVRILDKLEQDKLQYWGFSYGSVLGQYFAAMYPEKVGRLIIDGVLDAINYRAAWWTSIDDTDAVLDSFFHFCHQAGPLKCPLYAQTPSRIRERFDDIVQSVSKNPIPVPFGSAGPTVFTKKVLLEQIFIATYKPIQAFSIIADTIIAIESRNSTALANITADSGVECNCKGSAPIPWLAENEAFYAIACSDADKLAESPGDWDNYFQVLTGKSAWAGPILSKLYLECAEWKISAKARYTGPLAANNTYHPMLIVSTEYDPVCPLKDAMAVQKRYNGSRLLVQNSYGHCSLSAPSLCTAKHVRAYFVNGTLPEEGATCDVDELPFVGAVEQAGTMSVKDIELLGALKALGGAVPMFGNF